MISNIIIVDNPPNCIETTKGYVQCDGEYVYGFPDQMGSTEEFMISIEDDGYTNKDFGFDLFACHLQAEECEGNAVFWNPKHGTIRITKSEEDIGIFEGSRKLWHLKEGFDWENDDVIEWENQLRKLY